MLAGPVAGPVSRAARPEPGDPLPPCAVCGRSMAQRRKWASRRQRPAYCSQRCRRYRLGPVDQALEDAITRLLSERPAKGSICPSEAAREVRPDDWRPLMEPARMAARRLAAAGRVRVLQKGRAADPSRARGAIRLGAGRRGL